MSEQAQYVFEGRDAELPAVAPLLPGTVDAAPGDDAAVPPRADHSGAGVAAEPDDAAAQAAPGPQSWLCPPDVHTAAQRAHMARQEDDKEEEEELVFEVTDELFVPERDRRAAAAAAAAGADGGTNPQQQGQTVSPANTAQPLPPQQPAPAPPTRQPAPLPPQPPLPLMSALRSLEQRQVAAAAAATAAAAGELCAPPLHPATSHAATGVCPADSHPAASGDTSAGPQRHLGTPSVPAQGHAAEGHAVLAGAGVASAGTVLRGVAPGSAWGTSTCGVEAPSSQPLGLPGRRSMRIRSRLAAPLPALGALPSSGRQQAASGREPRRPKTRQQGQPLPPAPAGGGSGSDNGDAAAAAAAEAAMMPSSRQQQQQQSQPQQPHHHLPDVVAAGAVSVVALVEAMSAAALTTAAVGGIAVQLANSELGFAPMAPWKEGVVAPTLPQVGDARVGLLYDAAMERHAGEAHHLECPSRIVHLLQKLKRKRLVQRSWALKARKATDEELLRSHPQKHLDHVDGVYEACRKKARDKAVIYLEEDTYACSDTANAARYAAGCCVEAVREVLAGHVSSAMAVVRPPGHHAECQRAMGFCFFNNCVVAALDALKWPGVERVVVLDWDVHHGNGIQQLLDENPHALYISIHRDTADNFFPYEGGCVAEVGSEAGRGYNINIPWLSAGATDADYRAAFDLVVEPVLRAFQPHLVIVAAGFDAAEGDPLGDCKMSPSGYADLTRRMMQFAGGRVVLALEGGYNNAITAQCASACMHTMLGDKLSLPTAAAACALPSDMAYNSLQKVFYAQGELWPCLLDGGSFDEQWRARQAQGTAEEMVSEVAVLPAALATRCTSGAQAPGQQKAGPAAPAAAAMTPADLATMLEQVEFTAQEANNFLNFGTGYMKTDIGELARFDREACKLLVDAWRSASPRVAAALRAFSLYVYNKRAPDWGRFMVHVVGRELAAGLKVVQQQQQQQQVQVQ